MKLNTGKIGFLIEFDNGDKQSIFFNPNDPDLMVRMSHLEEKINEHVKEMEDVALDEEGNPIEEKQIKLFEEMQEIVKKELDYAFGGDISAVVFKHCSPFAIVGDEYFIVQFIRAITPEIVKHVKQATIDTAKRMEKHIQKYKK